MKESQKPGFWAVVFSTMAAAFGVQSKRSHERDFTHGNIWVFVVAGVIFTGLFIGTLFAIVHTILNSQ